MSVIQSLRDATTLAELEDLYPQAQLYETTHNLYRTRRREIEDGSIDTPPNTTATVQPLDASSDLTPELEPPPIFDEHRILDRVADAIEGMGVAGERRVIQLIYLVVVTRLLTRIVSMAIKGPSSAGKSFLVDAVLRLFPPSAFHSLSAMSEHALIYDTTDLRHRMLVIYEAAGMAGDLQTYIIRSLLSEGNVRYTTVEKTKEGIVPRTIEREGPTGLITTTTAVRLHPENETRLLSVTVTDSPAQTRAVLLAHAGLAPAVVDPEPWHALQDWLVANRPPVSVPYLGTLAGAIPPVAVRLRRDFPAVASLIRAHALLHQRQRDRVDGSIVATIEDYAVVRGLVADLIADAADRTVPENVRETVAAVRDDGKEESTVLDIATALGLDKSAASRRVRVALDRGYLKNLEDRRGRPLRLVLGDPLPADTTILPEPDELERLHGCTVVGGGNDSEPWDPEYATDDDGEVAA